MKELEDISEVPEPQTCPHTAYCSDNQYSMKCNYLSAIKECQSKRYYDQFGKLNLNGGKT